MAQTGLMEQRALVAQLRAMLPDVETDVLDLEMLANDDVRHMGAAEVVEHLEQVGRAEGQLAAMKHAAIACLCELEPEIAPELVATALDETTATSQRLCAVSSRVARVHPASLAILRGGSIGPRHVTVLERACRHLPADIARKVDAMVWALAAVRDPFQVKRAAQRLALSLDPTSAKARVAAARADRGVDFAALPDGVSDVTVRLCHEDALAVREELNRQTAAKDPADPRTRRQRAADALVELITGAPPVIAQGRSALTAPSGDTMVRARRSRRIELQVLVPLPTVLGLSDQPGEADRLTVPAEVVRALMAEETTVLRRLVTDPLTGHLLDRHPDTYKPSETLRAFVKARDQECLVPGCHVRARLCQEDHGTPFPDGKTVRLGLGDFCEHHHLLKHSGQGWVVTRDPDGTVHIRVNDSLTWHVPPIRLDHTGEPFFDEPEALSPDFDPLGRPEF